ncbi:MAG: hypothetical protein AAFR54_17965, partial [Planctomycetota bacterium]
MSDDSIRPDQPLPEDDAFLGFTQGGDPSSQNPEFPGPELPAHGPHAHEGAGHGYGVHGSAEPGGPAPEHASYEQPLDPRMGHSDAGHGVFGSDPHGAQPTGDPGAYGQPSGDAAHDALGAEQPVSFDAFEGTTSGAAEDSWLLEDGPDDEPAAGFAEVQPLPTAFEGVTSDGTAWPSDEPWEDADGTAPINEEDMVGASYVEPESTGSAVSRALVPGAIVLVLAFGGVGAWALLDQGASLPTDEVQTDDLAFRTPTALETDDPTADLDSVEGGASVRPGRVGFKYDGSEIRMGGAPEPSFERDAEATVETPREPGELAVPVFDPTAGTVADESGSDLPSDATDSAAAPAVPTERPTFVAPPLELEPIEEAAPEASPSVDFFGGFEPDPAVIDALDGALARADRAFPRFDTFLFDGPALPGVAPKSDAMVLAQAELDDEPAMPRYDDPFVAGPLALQFAQVGVPAGEPFVPFVFAREGESFQGAQGYEPVTAEELFANATEAEDAFVPFTFGFDAGTESGAPDIDPMDDVAASIAPDAGRADFVEFVEGSEPFAEALPGPDPMVDPGAGRFPLFGTMAFDDVFADAGTDSKDTAQDVASDAATEDQDPGFEDVVSSDIALVDTAIEETGRGSGASTGDEVIETAEGIDSGVELAAAEGIEFGPDAEPEAAPVQGGAVTTETTVALEGAEEPTESADETEFGLESVVVVVEAPAADPLDESTDTIDGFDASGVAAVQPAETVAGETGAMDTFEDAVQERVVETGSEAIESDDPATEEFSAEELVADATDAPADSADALHPDGAEFSATEISATEFLESEVPGTEVTAVEVPATETPGAESIATGTDEDVFASADDAETEIVAAEDVPVGPTLVGPLFFEAEDAEAVADADDAIEDQGEDASFAGVDESFEAEAGSTEDVPATTFDAADVPEVAAAVESLDDAVQKLTADDDTAVAADDLPTVMLDPEPTLADAESDATDATEEPLDRVSAETGPETSTDTTAPDAESVNPEDEAFAETDAVPTSGDAPVEAAPTEVDETEAHARLDAIFGTLDDTSDAEVMAEAEGAGAREFPADSDASETVETPASVASVEQEPTAGGTDAGGASAETTDTVAEAAPAIEEQPAEVPAPATVAEVVPSIVDPEERSRRASLLDRPGGGGIWPHRTVPKSKLKGDVFVLTPKVGNVRVVFDEGESIEGRLHGVGDSRIVVDTNIGRVTIASTRAARIDRLGRARAKDVGERVSTRGLERVRVRTAGGIFDGHLVSREGDRVTLLLGEGMRITVDASEVRPAGRSVSGSRIRRQ